MHWIPVIQQLPPLAKGAVNRSETVLVFWRNADGPIILIGSLAFDTGEWQTIPDDEGVFDEDDTLAKPVTHWMPLPDSPE